MNGFLVLPHVHCKEVRMVPFVMAIPLVYDCLDAIVADIFSPQIFILYIVNWLKKKMYN